jgi:hypothetical protein
MGRNLMAWEERSEHKYYYRKRREGDRIIFKYLGSGLEAAQYAQASQEKEKRIQSEHQRRIEMTSTSAQVEDICKTLNDAMRAWLLALGYHRHKRQWRKRRNVRD